MLNLHGKHSKHYPIEEAIRSSVSRHLYDVFCDDDEGLGNLDKWTQHRVHVENMAKIELALEADDPAEHCYQDLIREIDIEAESGIYLVGTELQNASLKRLADDPGISGRLHLELPSVAQSQFAGELEQSNGETDRVWVTIKARYDRAHLDASVSQLMMRFLLDSGDVTDDMTSAMRALLYSYHEDNVRHVCDLPSLLDERESRDLMIMVAELEKRSGSYDQRTREIRERAGTA
jgi:hypothetical protein